MCRGETAVSGRSRNIVTGWHAGGCRGRDAVARSVSLVAVRALVKVISRKTQKPNPPSQYSYSKIERSHVFNLAFPTMWFNLVRSADSLRIIKSSFGRILRCNSETLQVLKVQTKN